MKAKYLGLDLSSPVVVSSSPYTATMSNIEQCVRLSLIHISEPTRRS